MLKEEEVDVLIEDLKEISGHDFSFYSRDSFMRRINRLVKLEKLEGFEGLHSRLFSDRNYIHHFIDHITVNVTEMFRDSGYYKELRNTVLPTLADHSTIRIWHAGCSTGEEVFSTAILLKETGLLHKCEILATDINSQVLQKASAGVFSNALMPLYAAKYKLAGGEQDFDTYHKSAAGGEIFTEELRSRIAFKWHNLASDEYLGKFDLIVCRNVLIYFDKSTQEQVLRLFELSTRPKSFILLGEKETLGFSSISKKYSKIGQEMIWQKTS